MAAGAEVRPPHLWVEGFAFGRERLLAGAAVPWHDVAELAAFHRTLGELLDAPILPLPLADCYATWWDAAPDELRGTAATSRPGGALRAMLAAPAPRAAIAAAIDAVHAHGPVALEIPAPGAWMAWAAERAGQDGGGAEAAPDATGAARAGQYVAAFLRSFGECPVRFLLVAGDVAGDELAPIVKVAEHYRWHLVTLSPDAAADGRGVASAGDDFWQDGAAPPAGPIHVRVPADAAPDTVRRRLTAVRAEVTR